MPVFSTKDCRHDVQKDSLLLFSFRSSVHPLRLSSGSERLASTDNGEHSRVRHANAKSRPHDLAVAPDNSLWYTGQLANKLGRLDPRTGAWIKFPDIGFEIDSE
jgi:hypothetical protein